VKTSSLDWKKIFSMRSRDFVDVYTMRGCLCIFCLHLNNDITSWESNHPSDFVTRSFRGF